MRPIEKAIASKLIEIALEKGYTISVFDGEEYPLKRSTDAAAIMNALASTESDVIVLRKPDQLAKDQPIGRILLIWGNDHELISNHSDNALTNEVVARTEMEYARSAA